MRQNARNKNNDLNCRGFTLIELVVYMFVVVIFLLGLTNFSIDVMFSRTKSQSMQEVQQNLRLALLKISREIRIAEGINEDSVFDSNPGKLSLDMADDSGNDPTIFDLDGDRLRTKHGSNPCQYLTGDKVKITNLVFTDLSSDGVSRNIKIELSAEYLNPDDIRELKASLDLETAVSLRKN